MTSKVESKVSVASFTAALSSIGVWALLNHVPSLEVVSDPVAIVVTFLVTGLVTFGAGYMTKHTKRLDLEAKSPSVSESNTDKTE